MILHAINNFPIKSIVIMLGGSATIGIYWYFFTLNIFLDGGIGMASALGFKFIDNNGVILKNPGTN